MAPYSSASPGHLDSNDSSQFLNGLKTAATSVWETRMKFLCCCVGNDDHTRVAFSSTAELFSTYFSVSKDLVWPLSSVAVNTFLHAASPRPTHMQWSSRAWALGTGPGRLYRPCFAGPRWLRCALSLTSVMETVHLLSRLTAGVDSILYPGYNRPLCLTTSHHGRKGAVIHFGRKA
jgi:hypothetical protein